jgi:hypothetical protein
MTKEFDLVRASFAVSTAARVLTAVRHVIESGWRTSFTARLLRSVVTGWRATPAPARARHLAIAVGVAAALQPLLIRMMSRTVRPATPDYLFITIALLAGVAAWRPDLVARSWHDSRLARWLRR